MSWNMRSPHSGLKTSVYQPYFNYVPKASNKIGTKFAII